MARVGRLAGAILVETGGEYFLVGNTKTPCDWAAAGFEPPAPIDARARLFLRLARRAVSGAPAPAGPAGEGPRRTTQPVDLGSPVLALDLEGEEVARALAQRFVIERTGSVSERLWRLVVYQGDLDGDEAAPPPREVDAAWLGQIPAPLWQIVRDTVLRCS